MPPLLAKLTVASNQTDTYRLVLTLLDTHNAILKGRTDSGQQFRASVRSNQARVETVVVSDGFHADDAVHSATRHRSRPKQLSPDESQTRRHAKAGDVARGNRHLQLPQVARPVPFRMPLSVPAFRGRPDQHEPTPRDSRDRQTAPQIVALPHRPAAMPLAVEWDGSREVLHTLAARVKGPPRDLRHAPPNLKT